MNKLQDAIDKQQIGGAGGLTTNEAALIRDAARRVANPDLELAHRFNTLRIGGPTADGRVHLNGSLSSDEWGRLQTALGVTEDANE